ncbi:hypothetical protein ABPG74_001482 [Tetrahymena malaccensis]
MQIQMLISLFILFQLYNSVFCNQTLTFIEEFGLVYLQTSVQVGTPGISQKLQMLLGKRDESVVGQLLFDSSVKTNNKQYYEDQLKNLTLYDMYNSSTAKINPQQVQSASFFAGYGGYVIGNNVVDVMQVGDIQFNYTFLCATQEMQLRSVQNANGIIYLNKYQDNLFDQMFEQDKIKTRDYIVDIKKLNSLGVMSKYQMNLQFDLDKDSDYYKYPSNPMTNSDAFSMMAYGVYLNGQDISDKLKYFKVNFDYPVGDLGIGIPSDLYKLISQKHNFLIENCPNCDCPETKALPSFQIFTQEYVFEITSDMYLNQQPDISSQLCQVFLFSKGDQFLFQKNYQAVTQTAIMYEKESNSLKFIGTKTMQHMKIKNLMIILSLQDSFILLSLLYFILLFIKGYKNLKMECYQN